MKLIIQRVKEASVEVDNKTIGRIGKGILIFLGVKKGDSSDEIDWLVSKVSNLRIFEDDEGKMNLSSKDIESDFLIVPNFTLYADTKKGFRPSFGQSESPEKAKDLYNEFCFKLADEIDKDISRGRFGADMNVSLINDGPVTIEIEK